MIMFLINLFGSLLITSSSGMREHGSEHGFQKLPREVTLLPNQPRAHQIAGQFQEML